MYGAIGGAKREVEGRISGGISTIGRVFSPKTMKRAAVMSPVIGAAPIVGPAALGIGAATYAARKAYGKIQRGGSKPKIGVYDIRMGYIPLSRRGTSSTKTKTEPKPLPSLSDIFAPARAYYGLIGSIAEKGEKEYQKRVVHPIEMFIGGKQERALAEQQEKIQHAETIEEQEAAIKKYETMPKPSTTRQIAEGFIGTVVGAPGFIAFTTPRVLSQSIAAPTAIPSRAVAYGKGMYEFAKERPAQFGGSVAAMWALGGFKGSPVKPKLEIAKMPSGAKSYSLGFIKGKGTGLLRKSVYEEFYPVFTFTRKLPKVMIKERLEFGRPKTPEDVTIVNFAKEHGGYIAGSKAIYYQMPEGTVRTGADHDIYFAGLSRERIRNLATQLQRQLGDQYEVRISKGGNAQIYNKITGKQVVDMLPRKPGQDKVITKNGIPLRDYKQVLRDKRQILKHVSRFEPKYRKALEDLKRTEEAVKLGEYIIREYKGGISFKRYPITEKGTVGFLRLFGRKKGQWLPETPFETKIVSRIAGTEEPIIVEARGTRYFTIRSKVAPKEVRSGIIEILEREGVPNKGKVADAIIKELRKHDAELYGSLTQKMAGKTIGEPGLGRVARD
ncbi:MAG: hypothetical protein DRP62_08925, partial [Planctomycetota bacterium]